LGGGPGRLPGEGLGLNHQGPGPAGSAKFGPAGKKIDPFFSPLPGLLTCLAEKITAIRFEFDWLLPAGMVNTCPLTGRNTADGWW